MPNEVSMLQQAVHMFLFLAVELTILFIAISYLVGILQHYITPSKIQSLLSSKQGKGYITAAFMGAITPFCSCSTIPFLKGLLRAKAGFGPMMVFLFASPLLNPIIIGLFVVTFSWQVALFYFAVALVVAVVSGVVLERLGFEKYVKPEAYIEPESKGCSTGCGASSQVVDSHWLKIWRSTWKDFKQVLPYLLMGIAIGSFIYGFVPTELITQYAGNDYWYAIPIAAVIGIPLYIRAEAVIPLSAALVKKGIAMGSVMALIIGSAGASLTEVILLKSMFKNQLVVAFVSVIILMAITAGTAYSYLF